MSLDDASGDWLGDVSGLADQFTVVAEVEAEDVNGATAAIVTQATFTGAVEDDDSELVSADGSVKLGIPLGAFAEPTQISIGGSIAPLPDDFPGRIVVGPIAVKTNGAEPAMPATIRFPLPFDNEEAMLNQLDPSLLIVLAFDESTGLWSEVESTFHHGELAVESEVGQFGAFVLLERGIVDSNHGPEAAPGAGVGDAGDGTPGSDAAASADCGTGTCGGGMAFASPLMLALLGARRRRRGVRNARRRP